MDNSYSVFVNTTDRFEDCWMPFFKLFSVYWPDFKGKIYLNTEYKKFQYPGLNIISVQNCILEEDADKVTWSECLIRGLNSIETDIVLYMQEDYFFNATVKNEIIQQHVNLLKTDNLDCIHLTNASGGTPYLDSEYPFLKEVGKKAKYRVSCQAALWNKGTLLSYVRKHESPWQFEKFATKRARVMNHRFLAMDDSFYGGNLIMPYVLTGIIQGQWKEEVVQLFKDYNIKIDFSKRGFHIPNRKRSLYTKVKSRGPKLYKELISYIDLAGIRMKSLIK